MTAAPMISDDDLIQKAKSVLNPRRLSRGVEAGGVASALATDKGNVYVGVCIDTAASIGFCAEHAAIGSMITAGESKISAIVAVDWDGQVLSPCGRCREFIYQVNDDNGETRVILRNRTARLRELLPDHWMSESATYMSKGST